MKYVVVERIRTESEYSSSTPAIEIGNVSVFDSTCTIPVVNTTLELTLRRYHFEVEENIRSSVEASIR